MPEHGTGSYAQNPVDTHRLGRAGGGALYDPDCRPSETPPLSNRGDETQPNPPNQLLHWLAVTVHGLGTAATVRAVLGVLIPELPPLTYPKQWEGYGVTEALKLRWWNDAYQFPVPGMYVRGSPKDGGSYSQIEFTGTALEHLPPEQVHQILRALENARSVDREGHEIAPRLYATRVDVPFDGAPFTVKTAAACLETGHWTSRGRKLTPSYARNEYGETAYGGAKSADRRLCIYDRRGYVRCEYRAKDDYAHALLTTFLREPYATRSAAQAQIAGWIDQATGQTAIDALLWLTGGAEPAPNARAAVKTTVRQRGPQARLLSYVNRVLPYVRLWLEVTGTAPQALLDWPLTPRAEMMQRQLVGAINAKGQ